jgi:2-dehydro-3-deoxy-D-arabinonate dehydratase
MHVALYRVDVPGEGVRIARGGLDGPEELVPVDELAGLNARSLRAALDGPDDGPVPSNARTLAPVSPVQEVWAAGVTYERSREARVEETTYATPYDRVYEAERPELFFKAQGWRVRGPFDAIGIRADSGWDVPEPELALILDPDLRVFAYAVANDVSSRAIEGENPLYLPQAKTYDAACALGPALVAADLVSPPFDVRLEIVRDGSSVYSGTTSTDRIKRSFEELAMYLGRALSLPDGAVLLTGTGIVPDRSVSLRVGDTVRIEIDRIGILENRVELVG